VTAVQKATKAAKAVQKGTATRVKKIRTSVRFTRPKTYRIASTPKYARVSVPKASALDKFSIIKSPLFTDSSMKKLENQNTLTFLVDPRANKNQIKKALKDLHDISCIKVNTLIRYVPRPTGRTVLGSDPPGSHFIR
jgi:large subunit ribosomal protein L23Ae